MRDLLDRLDGWRDEQIELLARLVNHDSGTDDVLDVNRVGAILAERLEGLGFTLRRVATERFGDHLVGEKPGTGVRRFLFVGHYDTVFASGTAKRRPFRIEPRQVVRHLGPRLVAPACGDGDELDRALLAFLAELVEQGAQRVVADLAGEQRAQLAQRHRPARADERGLEDALRIQGLHVVVNSSAASRRGYAGPRRCAACVASATRRVRQAGLPLWVAPLGAVTSRWSCRASGKALRRTDRSHRKGMGRL